MVGPSAERLLVVLVVKEDMEEMEEDGVWVLRVGGGVVNVSILRSGSKGELDGEGEGVCEWTFIGKVKARGVGEITFSIGVVVTGSATATSRAWTEVSEGGGGDGPVSTHIVRGCRACGWRALFLCSVHARRKKREVIVG